MIFEGTNLLNGIPSDQNGIFVIDLEQKKTFFLDLFQFFPKKIRRADLAATVFRFTDNGYNLMDYTDQFYVLKQLFLYMAIANNGTTAFIDKNNLEGDEEDFLENNESMKFSKIYVLNPQATDHTVLDSFRNDLFSVKAMRFNAQGTRLFVDLRDKNNIQSIKEYYIQPQKHLAQYFEKTGVCKADKFAQNNV